MDYRLTDFLPTTKKEVELRGWDTLDVIYHKNMKGYGLGQLVMLYINWNDQQEKDGVQAD